MKNRYNIIFSLFALAFIVACDYEEDFDLSNTLPQYVEFGSGAYGASIDTTLVNGEVVLAADSSAVTDGSVSAIVRLREARDEDINVTVDITGDVQNQEVVTIPLGTLSASFTVTIPFTSQLNGTATMNISEVSGGLTVGRSGVDLDNTSSTISWSAE